AKYCLAYSTGGLSSRKTVNDIPINQYRRDSFISFDISVEIILSITYFKINGIINVMTNFTIPIINVHNILHLYGFTNCIYCLIVSSYLFFYLYSLFFLSL